MVRRFKRRDNEEPLPAVSWGECWAKTTDDGSVGVGVYHHCLTVGQVAEALLQLLPQPVSDQLPPGLPALAALHDVGKVCPGFQLQSDTFRESLRSRLPALVAMAYDERRGLQRLEASPMGVRRAWHTDSESIPTEDFINELDW